jgi:hypothetical protein
MVKHEISAEIILELIKTETTGKGGMFTIKSIKTDKEYTYKINRSFFKNKWYSHIFVETGYMNFLYLGMYSNSQIIKKGHVNNMPSAIAIAFILNHLEKGFIDFINTKTKFYHLGKCVKCGKILTDSNSIEIGMGPYCISVV